MHPSEKRERVKILFKKDALGNWFIFKRLLFFFLGTLALYRFKSLYKTKITGSEYVMKLPERNVLFVSNHQTYFADVTLMLLTIFNIKNGLTDRLGSVFTLFNPKMRIYFVAARETMKSGILPRLFIKAGGILIKRTWREKGKSIRRDVDHSDVHQIKEALRDGWVITFPQGTTTPYAKGRKGTAVLIKQLQPIVVPVVIDGMRRAFDKKGLFLKKKGTQITLDFKPPLNLDYENQSSDEILAEIMHAIEQDEYHQNRIVKEKTKD